jgi:DNA-directed RNA polymerase specialized sigma24 family protein
MDARDDNPIRHLLDQQDWGDLYARLLDFATHRCPKSPALAKDLTQEAIARVFSYQSKWDPQKEPDLLRYLMSVVNTLRSNERTSAAALRTKSTTDRPVKRAAEAVADPNAFSEAKVADHDLFSRRLTLLAERLVGDPEAHRLLELAVDGVDTPAEIRRITGWSAETVMSGRRRMLRAAAKVAQDLGSQDDPRDATDDDGDDDGDGDGEEVA